MALTATSAESTFLILAPEKASRLESFQRVTCDGAEHARVLSQMQVMRGLVALNEGAIRPHQLDSHGRHIMSGDSDSWHLLRMSSDGKVRGCVRILVHAEQSTFSSLRLASAAIAVSPEWGPRLKAIVELELESARQSSLTIVEPGGWVLDESLRGNQEAISLALSVFAWSQLVGGCMAYVTATVKHGSSSMLRRLGGRPIRYADQDIGRYYDPHYECEMEVLRIDNQSLNPKFEPMMAPLRALLSASHVIKSDGDATESQATSPHSRAANVFVGSPLHSPRSGEVGNNVSLAF
jgi:hypothetical protein